MEEELVMLADQFDHESITRIGQFEFRAGKIGDTDVVLLQCGIGKVNAAIGATLLIEKFKPDYLINTGVAGGVSDNVNIGDVVISSKAGHYDADATAFEYELGQIPKMPLTYEADTGLVSLARSVDLERDDVAVHQGAILSGDTFVHTPNQVSYLLHNFPEAMAVEMEGAAIAQTGFLFNVPFVLIRSISDKIKGADNASGYKNSLDLAAVNSVKMTLGILENMHRG